MVGDLKHFRPQIEITAVVLPRQKPAGFIVEVAGKQEAEPSIAQTEDDRVTVDGMGGGMSCEALLTVDQRLVPDPRSLGRLAEKFQRRLSVHGRGYWAQHVHSQIALVEKLKGLVVAE